MADNIKIRRLDNNEIDQIETLWNKLKQHHYDRTIDYRQYYLENNFSNRKAELLTKERLAIFLAKNDSANVGFCVVSTNGAKGEVDSLFVMPSQRKCHIGLALMEAGMAWLKKSDLKHIRLKVGQGNEEALSFYKKLGFRTRATLMEFFE